MKKKVLILLAIIIFLVVCFYGFKNFKSQNNVSQTQQKENQIGVSLRSKFLPVNKIAEKLGGGGHICASGAVVNDNLENVKQRVIELFKGA